MEEKEIKINIPKELEELQKKDEESLEIRNYVFKNGHLQEEYINGKDTKNT